MDPTTATPPVSTADLDRPGLVDGAVDTAGAQALVPEPLEEDLVADARASLTPAQMVELKLVFLLKSNPLPVSSMTGSRALRHR